jgi:hypothetical protein
MDFYPENILLEIISLLNAPSPPAVPLTGPEETELSLRDLNFVWWLEYFLRSKPSVFQEEFDSLPPLEQSSLVAQIGHCFLLRPLLRRLFPSKSRPAKTYPWKVARDGSLLHLTGDDEKEVTTGLFYIFPHRRLWPELATILEGKVSLTPADLRSVQTVIEFSLQSRLDDIRSRAEGLGFLLARPDPPPLREGEPPLTEQEPKIEAFSPKTIRKKKKSSGQLSLFE